MKKHIAILFACGLLQSCVHYDVNELDNLNGEVFVIGHAGLGFSSLIPFNPYPSNSLSSIKAALDKGIDGIEVDVHMTADKEFVLYHDNELDSKTASVGCPVDHSIEELLQLKYKLGFPFDGFQEEKIVSLETLVQELKKRGSVHQLHLDIRSHSTCHDTQWDKMWESILLKRLHKQLLQWDYPVDQVYLITYSQTLAKKVLRRKLPYHLNFEISGDVEEGIAWCIKHNIKSITLKPKLLTPQISKKLHDNGIELITFGGKGKSGNKELLLLNPDYIQTNNIDALKELLGKD